MLYGWGFKYELNATIDKVLLVVCNMEKALMSDYVYITILYILYILYIIYEYMGL